jgi:alpha-1,3-glucosyltransferase
MYSCGELWATTLVSSGRQCAFSHVFAPLIGMLFTCSMWPLLKKDGLGLQYLAMLLLWNRLIGHNPIKLHYGYFVGLVSSVRSASSARFGHS